MSNDLCNDEIFERMKILQISFNLSSGGAERFVVDLSNELSKTNEVTLLTLKDDQVNPESAQFYKFDLSPRVKYENLGLPIHYSSMGLWKVYRYIKKMKPDVVHMHGGNMPRFCLLANFLLGRKAIFVMTIHNDMNHGYKNLEYDVIHATLGRWGWLRFAALSEKNFRDLCRIYPHSMETCITNGRAPIKPTGNFDEATKEIEEYKKDCDTKVIIHVARCHPQKNQKLLIEGVNELVAEGRDVTLVILGANYESELGQELKDMACSAIHFLGPKTNVSDYLLNADLFTLSSEYEGMPISMLEAMLCGLPMVSTPVCGAVDVIDGKNGLMSKDFSQTEYVKALETVLDHLDEFKANAQARKENSPYTIERCAKKYVEFYKKRRA